MQFLRIKFVILCGRIKMSEKKSVFQTLNTLDINNDVKAIQGNRYLPWNRAWSNLLKHFPTATYIFHENSDGLPFFESKLGLFVKVSVTVNEITHTMTRPVYDFRNLSMMAEPRQVKYGKKMVDINAATANDINDSLMRCFTKTIAMHGLGLYIFEDKQFADAELLNASQITEISNIVAKNNLMLGDLNKAFGINKLSELYAVNYEAALKWLEDATRSN